MNDSILSHTTPNDVQPAPGSEDKLDLLKILLREMFQLDRGDGGATYSNPPSVDFLKANPYLVLDTQHFDRDFTDRLLAALSDAGSLDIIYTNIEPIFRQLMFGAVSYTHLTLPTIYSV